MTEFNADHDLSYLLLVQYLCFSTHSPLSRQFGQALRQQQSNVVIGCRAWPPLPIKASLVAYSRSQEH